jgi:hypothetical protein
MGAYIEAVTDALREATTPLTVEEVYRCVRRPPATRAGVRAR